MSAQEASSLARTTALRRASNHHRLANVQRRSMGVDGSQRQGSHDTARAIDAALEQRARSCTL